MDRIYEADQLTEAIDFERANPAWSLHLVLVIVAAFVLIGTCILALAAFSAAPADPPMPAIGQSLTSPASTMRGEQYSDQRLDF